jgi:hypothetical protein
MLSPLALRGWSGLQHWVIASRNGQR